MYTKYVKQSLEDILRGDVVEFDLYTEDGVLLLASGTKLDSSKRSLLYSLKSTNFDVYMKVDLDERTLKFDKVIELDKTVKERAEQTLSYMFNENTDIANSLDSVKTLSDSITDLILSSNSVSISLDALKCSDEYTYKHSLDVATISILIGRELGLNASALRELATAGLLHDVGKRNISKEILHKNGRLDDNEFEIIKQHPVFTYQLLQPLDQVSEVIKQACLQHHEKWNGSGYPFHLEGQNINYYSRILAVADVFDALVTDRPYHKHYTPSDTIEMMNSMIGHFDMDVYKLFLKTVVLYPVGTLITLSDGSHAIVIENNKANILRPIVKRVEDNKILNLLEDMSTFNLTIVSEYADIDAANPLDDKTAVAIKGGS